MKKPSKILILLSCFFLLTVFFVPIWYIKLDAPQYPGGLDMFIWINKITGTDEFTLQNINILNHYIGMAAIHPDSFAELKVMPYVLGSLIAIGVFSLILNSKKLLYFWVALVIIGGSIGLADFYLWQQAFGNNLDPEAPIKIPGMTYSPPFLGIKEILNIKATSLPHYGGIAFALAVIAAISVVFNEIKSPSRTVSSFKGKLKYQVSIVLLFFLASCAPKPQPIEYGFDSCAFCKMAISDHRYGTELVTKKGKIYKFDSIECLAMQLASDKEENHSFILVTNYEFPNHFIDATQAYFLQSPKLPSPMGMNLTAFENKKVAGDFEIQFGGKILSWEDIKSLVIKPHDNHAENHNNDDHDARNNHQHVHH